MPIKFEKTHLNAVEMDKKPFRNLKVGDTFRYPTNLPRWMIGEDTPLPPLITAKDKDTYMKIKGVIGLNRTRSSIYNFYTAVDFDGNMIMIGEDEYVEPISITANWGYRL